MLKRKEVSPLYGTMETHEQEAVLKAREGWRKVILSTPIAESSLTVSGILMRKPYAARPSVRIVVDTGLRRVKASRELTLLRRWIYGCNVIYDI